MARARTPQGRKWVRYSLTSGVALVVSVIILATCLEIFDWSAKVSNITAVSVSAIPSYVLNRRWAWGKSGKSHVWKEVVPFWVLALIGLGFSTWAADWAGTVSHKNTIAVEAASIGSFGILWVGKFIIFNEILFKNHPEELEDNPALDGRTGLPT